MNYELNAINLPVFYSPVEIKGGVRVAKSYELSASPITALHYHNTTELGLCLSGEGETYAENRIYKFKKGCVQVFPPKTPHLSKAYAGEASRWVYADINPAELFKRLGMLSPEGLLAVCDGTGLVSGVFSEDEYPAVTAAINKIISEAAKTDELKELSLAISAAEFLVECKRAYKKAGGFKEKGALGGGINGADTAATSVAADISPAVDYISLNLDGDLSEEILAATLKVSVSTLRRRFLERAGLNPKEFIIRSRMAYAEYLLRKTDLTVLEVSLRAGYNEISGFNRTFKNYFGLSPGKYRKES